jgi:hypothetical protein
MSAQSLKQFSSQDGSPPDIASEIRAAERYQGLRKSTSLLEPIGVPKRLQLLPRDVSLVSGDDTAALLQKKRVFFDCIVRIRGS